jgi:hypothetical protein
MSGRKISMYPWGRVKYGVGYGVGDGVGDGGLEGGAFGQCVLGQEPMERVGREPWKE